MNDYARFRLEEVGLNAWPPRHQFVEAGWVIRISEGFTGRANSITPLYPFRNEEDELVARIERWEETFRRQRLRPRFRLISLVENDRLISLLLQRGYLRHSETAVLNRPIVKDLESARVAALACHEAELETWIQSYVHVNPSTAEKGAGLEQICRRILWPHWRLLLSYEGNIVACGLGVRQHCYLGLFNIAVAPEARRQGFGRHMVFELLARGFADGARIAYLQVERDNQPALALYADLGFEEQYGYYYLSTNDEVVD